MSADLLQEARRRLDAGDPRSAHRLAERALESSSVSGSPETRWQAAHLVGEALFDMGDIAGARALAGEALRLSQASDDLDALGSDLNLLGVIEIVEGRLDEALFLLRRSYDLRARAGGADASGAIESLNNLAVALWRSGEEEEALALHEDALRRCERSLGEGHRRTAETLTALAVKLETRPEGRARARALHERAVTAAEAAQGPDSHLVGRTLANLAVARTNDGDLESAGPLLRRSLDLHERHFGPMSRWTAYVLDMMAEHAFAEGRYDEARTAFERAFVIRMNELGPTARETLDMAMGLMNTLAEIAGEARLVDETVQLDELFSGEAMDEATALELPLFALHPELVGTFPGGGGPDPTQAAEQLRRIAERIASRTGPDAAAVAAVERAGELVEAADQAYLSGDVARAVGSLREAISLLEAARGPSDTSLVEPLQRLKLVLRLGGIEAEVLPLLRRIASILADVYGEIHPLAIRALAEVFWQERREYGPAGGRETAARVEALVRDALGEENLVGELVRKAIAAARDVGEGMEPEDPPLSARRELFLAQPNPLADELLFDLHDTPWPTLDHAFGPAIDTPIHLRLLVADDERLRTDALELLRGSLLHQGSVYSATAPAVRLVRRLAADDRVPGRAELVEFLATAPDGV